MGDNNIPATSVPPIPESQSVLFEDHSNEDRSEVAQKVSGVHPVYTVIPPADQPEEKDTVLTENVENTHPGAAGGIKKKPDGWIDLAETEIQLAEHGIFIEGRKLRDLCARQKLESVKVRNTKKQWQHFVNPTSIPKFSKKQKENKPQKASGIQPVEQPVESEKQPEDAPNENLLLTEQIPKHDIEPATNKLIEFLLEQLSNQEQHIKTKDDQIKRKDDQIIALNKSLDSAQQLTSDLLQRTPIIPKREGDNT